MYEDYGTHTCAGYPGIIDHMELDAKTFAEWEVDYIKIDGCNSDPKTMDKGFPEFGRYLNETGRPIVYSCEWPLYQEANGISPDFDAIEKYCNVWRNWVDVSMSWKSIHGITDFFASKQSIFNRHNGPGGWNDPDMVYI